MADMDDLSLTIDRFMIHQYPPLFANIVMGISFIPR
jgi:hypothetical protein